MLKEEKDIIELREKIHKRNELVGPPNQLEVYPPGTKVPVVHGTKQLEDEQLALLNQKQEVIVVAPHSAKGVMLDTAPPKETPEQLRDRSQAILNAWSQPHAAVPRAIDLPSVVQSPLPRALPSPYQTPILDEPVDDVVLSTNEGITLDPALGSIRESILSLDRIGDNEDSIHSLVDPLVMRPMKLLGRKADCSFQMQRNGVDSTWATIQNLRPDVLVWLPSGLLAFKGEDKATENELQNAKNELMSKLGCFSDAFFGSLPYQICYAAGGFHLQFMAIIRSPGMRPTLTPVSPIVDLSTIRGRSFCVRYAVNITRVLILLQRTYPDGAVARLGEKIENPNSVVFIFGEYVIKKTKHYTGDVLGDLYALIEDSKPPCLVSTQHMKISTVQKLLTVHISPVGFCGRRPENLEEVKVAGWCVLTALHWLHDNGWVHRDVRPSNIMFAGGTWYLMDLEWADKVTSSMESYAPRSECLPPESAGVAGGMWTTKCDMWQFGKLIQYWDHLDEYGRSYVKSQDSTNPAVRLSAEHSLSHQFFKAHDKEVAL